MTSLILQTAARYLAPLLLLFSLLLLLRGHDDPGGGFAGGLVAAAAFSLNALAFDVRSARRALGVDPRVLVGVGLLLALGSGAFGLAAGRPLLTGRWWEVAVPGFGRVAVGTPIVFDVGVYLVVLGMVCLIVLSLAEE